MVLRLKIASALLNREIPYKYTVYSPKTRNAAENHQVYESIDIGDGKMSAGITNRVLIVEKQKG